MMRILPRIIHFSAGFLAFGLMTCAAQAPRIRSQQTDKPRLSNASPTQPETRSPQADYLAPEQKSLPAKAEPAVEAPVQSGGVRYESGRRRDPFLSPIVPKKKDENPDEEAPRGPQPPGIGGMFMAQVKLLGIASGTGAPTAVFQGTDKRAYFLQEKDKLFDGFIKRIEPDSVILIRETKLRSGRINTQEITKRLRTP